MTGVESTTGSGRVFWVAMAVGGAITLFGVYGILTAEGNGLGSFIPWFVGGALLVDLVVVPSAAGIGLVGRRLLPTAVWPAARAGLIATAALVAFAAPLVADVGGRPDNPSLRPRSYGSGLLSALLVVWAVVALVATASWSIARTANAPTVDAGLEPDSNPTTTSERTETP